MPMTDKVIHLQLIWEFSLLFEVVRNESQGDVIAEFKSSRVLERSFVIEEAMSSFSCR
jgi:hypothetical protein